VKLIELILNNWFVVVVLFFILSTFLKRSKAPKEGTPQKSNGPSMPSFGGGGGTGSGWGQMLPKLNRGQGGTVVTKERPAAQGERKQSPVVKSSDESSRTSVERKTITREDVPDFWDSSPLNNNVSESQPSRSNHYSQEISPKNQNRFKQPSANQLAQGVLWAEILGPPRSKKPFRR
jgi:hypothetical protein